MTSVIKKYTVLPFAATGMGANAPPLGTNSVASVIFHLFNDYHLPGVKLFLTVVLIDISWMFSEAERTDHVPVHHDCIFFLRNVCFRLCLLSLDCSVDCLNCVILTYSGTKSFIKQITYKYFSFISYVVFWWWFLCSLQKFSPLMKPHWFIFALLCKLLRLTRERTASLPALAATGPCFPRCCLYV